VDNRHDEFRILVLEAHDQAAQPIEVVLQVAILRALRSVRLIEDERAIRINECPLSIHRIVHGRNERIDFVERLSPNLDGLGMPDVTELIPRLEPSRVDRAARAGGLVGVVVRIDPLQQRAGQHLEAGHNYLQLFVLGYCHCSRRWQPLHYLLSSHPLKIICLILSLFITQAWGATLCVGPSSSGSANGTDWNNKLAWGTLTFVRGNTYYLEDGSYAAKELDIAISGATQVIILKATVADHGTSTGWSDTMGDGQAAFADQLLIETGNWTINGQVGSGYDGSTYGFKVNQQASGTSYAFEVGSGVQNLSNIVVAYTYWKAPTTDDEKMFFFTQSQANHVNYTVTNCFSDGAQCFFIGMGVQGMVVQNNIITNSFSGAHHGDVMNLREGALGACRNITIKNNRSDSNGTGWVVINDDGVGDDFSANGVLITGNVIGPSWTGGNGVICTTTRAAGANITVVNNTFWFCTNLWISAAQSGSSTAVKNACTNWFATNNILYTMSGALGNNATALITNDYNYYVSCTSVPTEANGVSTSSDPFVSVAGRNFNLGVAVPGLALGSTFSPDPNGVTRGADGTWDSGAYEFVASTPTITGTLRVRNLRAQNSYFR